MLGAGVAHHRFESGRPVLGAHDLVPVRRVRDPPGRGAEHVLDHGIEVDPVAGLREVLTLHRERGHPVAHRRVHHRPGVPLPGRRVGAFHDRVPGRAVLDDPAPDEREPRLARGGERSIVGHDRIVHEVGDGPAPVAVEPVREDAEHVGLEVVHQIATDDVRVAELGAQQESRGFERAGREHDVARRHFVRDEIVVEVPHPTRPAARRVAEHVGDVRLRPDLAPSGSQRVP